ncbi:MAG: TIGR03084 family metal-binding protein [Actinomycetota bacterium]|nr:TIGR03084 family metal-binding protein [Actinomycetota bacterium]
MADPYADLLVDLSDEQVALDALVATIASGAWELATPAEGWALRDQMWHLTYFDAQARRAATDPDGFTAGLADVMADPTGWEAGIVAEGRTMPAAELLSAWRAGRAALHGTFAQLDAKARLPWYGPPMSAMSFATARLMETWAHGQDVVDGLAAAGLASDRPPTDRLRHIAHLGVRTRSFSYEVRGRAAPEGDVRVELRAPSGDAWSWGEPSSADRVSGAALDFCLLVTQRRHVDDVDLAVDGPLASEWMAIAQCFAGGAGTGRAQRSA